VHRLVCSGLARQGQTGRALLDSIALDVLLDFAVGEITAPLEPKQREEMLANIAALDAPAAEKAIEVVKNDGTVVYISQARLDRIRKNQQGISQVTNRRGKQ
jgi:hypothetical protein